VGSTPTRFRQKPVETIGFAMREDNFPRKTGGYSRICLSKLNQELGVAGGESLMRMAKSPGSGEASSNRVRNLIIFKLSFILHEWPAQIESIDLRAYIR